MLNVKRPYIYNPYGYTDDNTSVAGLLGKIELLFDRDTYIKVIKFTHEFFADREVMKYNEFANLINEKYNLDWVIDNEDDYGSKDYRCYYPATSFADWRFICIFPKRP